ncbi:MAG: hypothetical protein ACREN8_05945 [Candidatus Dormibacteraceae bacterium]
MTIDTVDWTYGAEHIQQRSQRKGHREYDLEPQWATEATLDRKRLVRDSGSKSGQTIAIIGYSPSIGKILTVILIPKDHPARDAWWGVSAWLANKKDQRAYTEDGGIKIEE